MEYFDFYSLTPIESAILSLKNYLMDLYEKNEEVRKSIRNIGLFKSDLMYMKEKLELGKEIRSIEYARRMKEFGLIADMLNIEYDKILENKKIFPIFACIRNAERDEIYILVEDITKDGVLVKDKDKTLKIIRTEDFKKAYKNRLFFITDYKPLMKKYKICDKEYDKYINKGISLDGLSAVDSGDVAFAIISGLVDAILDSL